jgi:hypothetical protein
MQSDDEQVDIDDLIDQYLRANLTAAELFQRDAAYRMQVKWFG